MSVTPTQYVVNTLYWPHTALSVYLVCYFLVPHTHVLCMGSGSATGKKIQVRLVHSLLKYFFKFQLWYSYWIKNLHYQIFKFVIDNSDISLNCLQHIQKRRNFDAKVTCHQPICLLLHAILSGVGVMSVGIHVSFSHDMVMEVGTLSINSFNIMIYHVYYALHVPNQKRTTWKSWSWSWTSQLE